MFTFLMAATKDPTSNFWKARSAFAPSSRVQSIMGETWLPSVRQLVPRHPVLKQQEMNAGAQLTFSFLFHLGPHPVGGATSSQGRSPRLNPI